MSYEVPCHMLRDPPLPVKEGRSRDTGSDEVAQHSFAFRTVGASARV